MDTFKPAKIDIYPDLNSNEVIVKITFPEEYSDEETKSLLDAVSGTAKTMDKKIRWKHVFRRYGNK